MAVTLKKKKVEPQDDDVDFRMVDIDDVEPNIHRLWRWPCPLS